LAVPRTIPIFQKILKLIPPEVLKTAKEAEKFATTTGKVAAETEKITEASLLEKFAAQGKGTSMTIKFWML